MQRSLVQPHPLKHTEFLQHGHVPCVRVQAGSRVGLLSAISAALAEAGLTIASARVASRADAARRDVCTFAVHAATAAGPVTDAQALQALPAVIAAHVDRAEANTQHLALLTRSADIVVVAVGLPELVKCVCFTALSLAGCTIIVVRS